MSEKRHMEYLKLKAPQTTRNRTFEVRRDSSFIQRAQQRHNSIEKSRERRMDYLSKGVQKITKHLSDWEEKKNVNRHTLPKKWGKERVIEKARANVKGMNLTRAMVIAEKNKLRQEDVQEVLLRNKELFEEKRAVLLDKYRDFN